MGSWYAVPSRSRHTRPEWSITGNRRPSRGACASSRETPRAIAERMRDSASGWTPAPKRAFICASETGRRRPSRHGRSRPAVRAGCRQTCSSRSTPHRAAADDRRSRPAESDTSSRRRRAARAPSSSEISLPGTRLAVESDIRGRRIASTLSIFGRCNTSRHTPGSARSRTRPEPPEDEDQPTRQPRKNGGEIGMVQCGRLSR